MKFVINEDELKEIIIAALEQNGVPINANTEIIFAIDRASKECYCSIDLGELDLKATSALVSNINVKSLADSDDKRLPIDLVSPKRIPLSGETRIKLGSPRNIDDMSATEKDPKF